MDYSLLLITENNPDYFDDSCTQLSHSNHNSIKSVGDLGRLDTSPLLKGHPSGIPEVEEEQEEEEQEEEDVKPHKELMESLDM